MKENENSMKDRAAQLVNRVNEGFGDETFVSEGYGYFDEIVAAVAAALVEARDEGRGCSRGPKACDETITRLQTVVSAVARWRTFVEQNGGNYLPGHAQQIFGALDALQPFDMLAPKETK